MLYFTRWKALAIILTALVVCLCAVPNFFPESRVKTWPAWAQRHLVLGLDLQGGSYLLLEVDSNYVKKDKLDQVRDDVRRTLRDAKIGYTGLATKGDSVEVRITKEADQPTALAKLRDLSQPLGGLLGSSGQRSLEVSDAGGNVDPPDRSAGRDHRSGPSNHRAVDSDRRAPRQRTRHRRAVDPAPGHRSHPGAGSWAWRSVAPDRPAGPDRQDGFPDGRYARCSPSRRCRARCRRMRKCCQGAEPPHTPYVDQETGSGVRRRSDRRTAGLRPALGRADRQLPLQYLGLPQIRAGHLGECRAALCHRSG